MLDVVPTPWASSTLRRCDPIYLLNNMEDVRRCLEPAIARGHGEWRFGDIVALILQGYMHLWASERNGRIEAVCVTQWLPWPTMKALNFVFIGGEKPGHWIEMEDEIAAWAKKEGATELRGIFSFDRLGWLRWILRRGWRQCYVVVRRPI